MDNPIEPDQMREAGFAACLTKPLRQSQLLDSMMDAVADGRAQASEASAGLIERPAERLPPPAALRLPVQARSLPGVRVLLAEDNLVNQAVARELLTDAGCRVDVVPNGLLAVGAADQHFAPTLL